MPMAARTSQKFSSEIFPMASRTRLAIKAMIKAMAMARLESIELLQVPALQAHVQPSITPFNLLVRVHNAIHLDYINSLISG
jgi:hypothetical protein